MVDVVFVLLGSGASSLYVVAGLFEIGLLQTAGGSTCGLVKLMEHGIVLHQHLAV